MFEVDGVFYAVRQVYMVQRYTGVDLSKTYTHTTVTFINNDTVDYPCTPEQFVDSVIRKHLK